MRLRHAGDKNTEQGYWSIGLMNVWTYRNYCPTAMDDKIAFKYTNESQWSAATDGR
jgi:hypothetical protein